jgi:hypothetical protein
MENEAEVFRVWRRCPTCAGAGILIEPHCRICDRQLENDDAWWETEQHLLPCGHEAAPNLVTEVHCITCNGAGKTLQLVSSTEYQAMARRRLRRSAILILVALIPLVALLLAVTEQERALACGRWWYGIALPLLAGWTWRDKRYAAPC